MPASAVVDIRHSFGAAFIGLIINTILFGFTLAQTWMYYWHYGNKDAKRLKILIAFVTVMDTFHTFLCAYMIYWYLVLHFGDVKNLNNSVWAFDIQSYISSIYTAVVHFYYARRIYILSQSIVVPIIVVSLVVGGNAIGLFMGIKTFGVKFSKRHYSHWLPNVAMFIVVFLVVLIAAAMCRSLYRMKTGFARTDSTIMTLMAYSVNSCLLTSLLGIAMIVSNQVASSTMVAFAIYWVMSKCYVNSLLASLNSRDYIRDRSHIDDTHDSFNLSSIRIDPPSKACGAKSRQTSVSVTVHRSTTSVFASRKSDDNVEPTLEIPKLDTTIIPPPNLEIEHVGSFHAI